MDFTVRKRKSWSSDSGVSEIVGNILILMITVVLFSTIIAWVNVMPVPQMTKKVDFEASISFADTGGHANLTVTHAGGVTLKASETKIIVHVDDMPYGYVLSSDPDFGRDTWTTGVSWTKDLAGTGVTTSSSVTVTVLDLVEHNNIWVSQVSGGTGGSPPMILQRYVDSNRTTPTADPVKLGDSWSLFVRITDLDLDLDTSTSSIYVDASNIGGSSTDGYEAASGDWYRWDYGTISNVAAVDGKILRIFASDSLGHQTISSYVMEVTILPAVPVTNLYPAYTSLGTSGLPAYLSYVSDNSQGFGTYHENITNGVPQGVANTSLPDTEFTKDENVFIRYASLVMSNVFGENELSLIDTRTGLTYPPVWAGSSTSDAPFYPFPTGGSAYVYEAGFNTSNLPPGAYTISMSLKNLPTLGGDAARFRANLTIIVTGDGYSIDFIPEIYFWTSNATNVPWGESREEPFQVTSANYNTIYVSITVQDAQTTPAPNVVQIRVNDLAGNSMVYGGSPSGSMISSIYWRDSTSYKFAIDLRQNNGDMWLPGINSYTVYISKFNDTNEGMYSMSKQVFIQGGGARSDFLMGTTGIAAGNANFNTREYVYYVQNNNFFTSRVMWYYESSPGSAYDYTITAMASGDVDGDGDEDVLAGTYVSRYLLMIENTLDTFGTWQAASLITRPDGNTYWIVWIDFGDINGDGHPDFAYANNNNEIVIFNTTYGSTGWIYSPPNKWTGTISKIMLEDITGDGRADLIVLANGRISIYDIKYSYDPLLKSQEATKVRLTGTPFPSSGSIVDFDVADVNLDGKLDIVTTGTDADGGAAGVKVRYFSVGTGTKKTLDPTDPYDPLITAGTTGSSPADELDNTYNMEGTGASGTYFRLQETSNGTNAGKVIATMKFQTLTTSPDQQLTVYARIGNLDDATPQESFYIWYSIDGIYFVPVLTISSSSWGYYNFSLPQSVAGKAIYLKVTDSLTSNTTGLLRDYIDLDYVAVLTDLFNGFTISNVVADTTYTAVRAGNIDGTYTTYLNVIIAKNGASNIKVYRYMSGSWGLLAGSAPASDATFYVVASSKHSSYTGLSPTLFDVTDINGDSYDDVLVANYTSSTEWDCISKVGFHVNLFSSGSQLWRFFNVMTVTNDRPTGGGGTPDPWIVTVIATNLATNI